jgi:hypothetical protein
VGHRRRQRNLCHRNWAQVTSAFSPNPGAAKQGNLSIRCDNAYLPASVAAGCVSGYPTGVMSVGTANAEFPANINVHPTRTQRRLVLGANGKFGMFGKEWTYDAYAEHGENTTVIQVKDITLNRAITSRSTPSRIRPPARSCAAAPPPAPPAASRSISSAMCRSTWPDGTTSHRAAGRCNTRIRRKMLLALT